MTERPPINMKPFPVDGMVPYLGQLVRIQSRRAHPASGYLYCVHTRAPDRELLVHGDVPHAVLLAAIGAVAHYAVGQRIVLFGRHALQVMHRKWSFRQGTVVYAVANPGAKMGMKVFTQEQLFQAVEAEEVPEAYQRPGSRNLDNMF